MTSRPEEFLGPQRDWSGYCDSVDIIGHLMRPPPAGNMGGYVGKIWALKAYQAYRDRTKGDNESIDMPQCCE